MRTHRPGTPPGPWAASMLRSRGHGRNGNYGINAEAFRSGPDRITLQCSGWLVPRKFAWFPPSPCLGNASLLFLNNMPAGVVEYVNQAYEFAFYLFIIVIFIIIF